MAAKKTRRPNTSEAPGARPRAPAGSKGKRVYFKQAEFPAVTLQEARRIADAIVDNFGGTGGSPPDIALAIEISPTSSGWQTLTGASIAYGLTDGGYNANVIKLTVLGRKLVAPEAEGADVVARREAILKPRLLKEFFERYRRAKFPQTPSPRTSSSPLVFHRTEPLQR
jgi:hypothetical protein